MLGWSSMALIPWGTPGLVPLPHQLDLYFILVSLIVHFHWLQLWLNELHLCSILWENCFQYKKQIIKIRQELLRTSEGEPSKNHKTVLVLCCKFVSVSKENRHSLATSKVCYSQLQGNWKGVGQNDGSDWHQPYPPKREILKCMNSSRNVDWTSRQFQLGLCSVMAAENWIKWGV